MWPGDGGVVEGNVLPDLHCCGAFVSPVYEGKWLRLTAWSNGFVCCMCMVTFTFLGISEELVVFVIRIVPESRQKYIS
jgi:hypothetical protein